MPGATPLRSDPASTSAHAATWSGCGLSPITGTPSDIARSAGPIRVASTPGTERISSIRSTAPIVSIWMMQAISSSAWAA